VRETGYAHSHGEVEQGAHAVASPIPGAYPAACLVLLTTNDDRAVAAVPAVIRAAASLGPAVP